MNLTPAGALQAAGLRAIQEAKALEKAGFQGIILENFGDAPFYKNCVPPETVAGMSVIAAAVRESVRIPLGINVLRNDARAALAIASVAACEMIRVNVLSGVAATDQGLIEGDAAYLIRERDRLGSEVRILADIQVKHARTLSTEDIGLSVEEVVGRGGASGVIVTGATTGRPADLEDLAQAKEAARSLRVPVYVGSGTTVENAAELAHVADGFIIGSALRKGGRAGAPLDVSRIKGLLRALR